MDRNSKMTEQARAEISRSLKKTWSIAKQRETTWNLHHAAKLLVSWLSIGRNRWLRGENAKREFASWLQTCTTVQRQKFVAKNPEFCSRYHVVACTMQDTFVDPELSRIAQCAGDPAPTDDGSVEHVERGRERINSKTVPVQRTLFAEIDAVDLSQLCKALAETEAIANPIVREAAATQLLDRVREAVNGINA